MLFCIAAFTSERDPVSESAAAAIRSASKAMRQGGSCSCSGMVQAASMSMAKVWIVGRTAFLEDERGRRCMFSPDPSDRWRDERRLSGDRDDSERRLWCDVSRDVSRETSRATSF